MDKYGFILDGALVETFNSTDSVQMDMNEYAELGHKVIWVKLLAVRPEEE